jgi:hypothetical protein
VRVVSRGPGPRLILLEGGRPPVRHYAGLEEVIKPRNRLTFRKRIMLSDKYAVFVATTVSICTPTVSITRSTEEEPFLA